VKGRGGRDGTAGIADDAETRARARAADNRRGRVIFGGGGGLPAAPIIIPSQRVSRFLSLSLSPSLPAARMQSGRSGWLSFFPARIKRSSARCPSAAGPAGSSPSSNSRLPSRPFPFAFVRSLRVNADLLAGWLVASLGGAGRRCCKSPRQNGDAPHGSVRQGSSSAPGWEGGERGRGGNRIGRGRAR